MRRYLGWIAIGWLVALSGLALLAYGAPSHPASLDDRALAVAATIRCPACQGESVADSPTDLARAIRVIIRRQVAEGWSANRIRAYFVARYGPSILLAPPAGGIDSLAWLVPPLMALAGLGLLATLVLEWRRRAALPQTVDAVYVERVRAELLREGLSDGSG